VRLGGAEPWILIRGWNEETGDSTLLRAMLVACATRVEVTQLTSAPALIVTSLLRRKFKLRGGRL
jgi:hypothetical protein